MSSSRPAATRRVTTRRTTLRRSAGSPYGGGVVLAPAYPVAFVGHAPVGMYVGQGRDSYYYLDPTTGREIEYYPYRGMLYTYYPSSDSLYSYTQGMQGELLVMKNYRRNTLIVVLSVVGACCLCCIVGAVCSRRGKEADSEEVVFVDGAEIVETVEYVEGAEGGDCETNLNESTITSHNGK